MMNQTNQQKKSNLVDQHRLNILAELCSYRIEELLESLDVQYKKIGKALHGCCPVHGGNRTDAWNFYPDGHSVRGIWFCRSRQCEKHFVKNIIGLVRGILSQKRGWTPDKPELKKVSIEEAKQYLLKFLGKKWEDIKIDIKEVEKAKFISNCNLLGKPTQTEDGGWSIKEITNNLLFPAQYYINRNYQKDTLEKFLVGQPKNPKNNSKMIDRVVVPVLNKDGTRVIGITGRSIFEKCNKCGRWHNPNEECPNESDRYLPSYAKWRNIDKFETRHHIYNLWNNKDKDTVVIVEGPGDVWRLHEAGINNAIALFGCSLTDQQQILLESTKVMNIYLLLDKDKAGEIGINNIKSSLDRMFNIKVLSHLLQNKDVGEMSVQEIKEKICPNIK